MWSLWQCGVNSETDLSRSVFRYVNSPRQPFGTGAIEAFGNARRTDPREMPHRRFELNDRESPQVAGQTEPCARCRAKGIVVCPECQGTGDKRNASYVVVDRCHTCVKEARGFITCPSCLGTKVVDAGQLLTNHRLESERMRKSPAVWGFTLPPVSSRRLFVPAPRLDP
jgi:hypothetical protein